MKSDYSKEVANWYWARSWTPLSPEAHRSELRHDAVRLGIEARRDAETRRTSRTEDGQAATHHPHQVDRREKAFRYPVGG